MSKLIGEKMLMRFEYDFAKQGGAIGVIELPQVANNMPEGAKILNAIAVAEEALVGPGAAVTFGIASDSDRYLADSFAKLSSGELVSKGSLELNALATDVPVMEIAGAALTAGKVAFYLEILA